MMKFNNSTLQDPKHPELDITIYYSFHLTRKDYEALPQLFHSADIFIPERAGWTQETLTKFIDLSYGNIERWQNNLKTWLWFHGVKEDSAEAKLVETIYNSRKPIVFIDVPAGNSIAERANVNFWGAFDTRQGYNALIKQAERLVKGVAVAQDEREQFILKTFESVVKNTIRNDRLLSGKDSIKLLLTLGGYHTQISDSFLKKGYKVQEIKREPEVLPFLDEALRKYISKESIDAALLTRVVIDAFMFSTVQPQLRRSVNYDTYQLVVLIREVLSSLTEDEMQQLLVPCSHLLAWTQLFMNKLAAKESMMTRTEEKELARKYNLVRIAAWDAIEAEREMASWNRL